jgi:tetratricopeptide (TPR) repeat protein
LLRAEQLRRSGDLRAALDGLAQSADAAMQGGRPDLAARAHLAMARLHRGFLDGPAVAKEANEAARLYRQANDPGGELEAEWAAAFPLFLSGQIGAFIDRGLQLRGRAVDLGEHARAAGILAFLAQVAALSGRPAEARAWSAEAAGLAAEHGLRTAARRSDHAEAILARMAGDAVSAEAILRRLLADVEEAGEEWDVLTFQTELTEVLIDQGKLAEADSLMQRAQQSSERMGERWQRVPILVNRAQAALGRADLAMAETCIRQAVAAAHPEDFVAQAATHRTLGCVLAARGASEEADATFRRGLELGRAREPSFATVDLSLAYAEFLVGRNREQEARPLLDSAEQWLGQRGYAVRSREIGQLRARLDQSVSAQP